MLDSNTEYSYGVGHTEVWVFFLDPRRGLGALCYAAQALRELGGPTQQPYQKPQSDYTLKKDPIYDGYEGGGTSQAIVSWRKFQVAPAL